NGRIGITVDQQGQPVAVIAICHDSVDQAELFLGREGLKEDEANPVVATWKASDRITGTSRLSFAAPDGSWQPNKAVSVEPEKHYIITASRSDADVEAAQVDFFSGD